MSEKQPRPTVTDEMIREAVLSVVLEMSVGDVESTVDSVCRQYRHPMDGFDLAMGSHHRHLRIRPRLLSGARAGPARIAQAHHQV